MKLLLGTHLGVGTLASSLGLAKAANELVRAKLLTDARSSPYSTTTAADLEAYRPDLWLVFHGYDGVNQQALSYAAETGIKTVLWLSDDPYCIQWSLFCARRFGHILSNDRGTIQVYDSELGRGRAHFMPLGYDPEVHHPGAAGERPWDIILSGTRWPERSDLMVKHIDLLRSLRAICCDQWYGFLDRVDYAPTVENRHPFYTPNNQLAALYQQTVVVPNLHRSEVTQQLAGVPVTVPAATHLNPRCFEVAACGAVPMVNEERSDRLEQLPSVATFKKETFADDLMRAIREAPDRRAALLEEVKPHTYLNRLKAILELFA